MVINLFAMSVYPHFTKGLSFAHGYTRVYKEAGKYKVGELYKAPWGDILKINEVKKYWKVSDLPFYDEMTDDEKDLIRKYSEDMGLPYEWIKFSKQPV